MIRIASAAALLLLCMLTASDGFNSMIPVTSKHAVISEQSSRFLLKATVQEELTDADEDVLFGGKDVPFPGKHRKKSRTGNLLPDRSSPLNPLDHSAQYPLINKLRGMRQGLTNCPGLWREMAEICPDKRALLDEHLCDETVELTFGQMEETVRKSAAAFSNLGIKRGSNVAILGENSARWLIADHGIQLLGGATAVRGADAPGAELRYIYEHSDSAGVAVLQGPRLMNNLLKDAEKNGMEGLGLSNESHGPVKTVVLLQREKKDDAAIAELAERAGVTVHVFADLIESTAPLSPFGLPDIGLDDLSTIVYTSGTTGNPKGVMLTHGNLLHQLGHRLAPTEPYDESEPLPGEKMLSLLPVWHITERTFELWMLSRGCSVVYSSIRTFKNDLAKHQPEWMVLVPRVLEKVAMGVQGKFAQGSAVVKALVALFTATGNARDKNVKISQSLVVGDEKPGILKRVKSKLIVAALAPLNAVGNKLVWSKVQDGFGGKVKTIISGGSALAGALEEFYERCGINVIVGYGLTECSPLIAHRRSDANLITAGCVGKACLDTELRVVDPELNPNTSERPALPDGEIGVVVARGPQVMQGYYKNAEATSKAIDSFGWFDTGDLGKINPATSDLILTGRCKDTIVLSNGENIEPSPIEDAILSTSPLIEQVMLTGQDGRSLTAIAVLTPSSLVAAGYLDKRKGKKLQEENEKVNNPQCSEEDCANGCEVLALASEELRSNKELQNALMADMKKATKDFRPWEKVGDVYVTLEPFAMANGLLTQSYKVKRDFVLKRYGAEL